MHIHESPRLLGQAEHEVDVLIGMVPIELWQAAYPVGAREMASRLAADLPTKAETIKTIVHRVS